MIAVSKIRVLVCALSCFLTTIAQAGIQRVELPLSTDAVTAYTAPDSSAGSYYVLTFDVPGAVGDGKITSAVLEFYADVSADSIDGWVNETPVVELYALKQPITEDFDLSAVHGQSVAVKPIRVGEARRIILDVTSIVRAWVQDPSLNHGMILGSFRGVNEGVFSIRDDHWSAGERARLTILYETSGEGAEK